MGRMTGKLAALVLGLTCLGTGRCDTASRSPGVQRCDQATNARPGLGRSFTGRVANDDYAFTVNIPSKLIAWDGVAEEATFHGFVLFLDSRLQACIVFDIQIRVDDKSMPDRASSATQMRLGEAKARQSIRTDGRLANVSTTFSFEQTDEIDDGEVLLIASESERPWAQGIYDTFVRSLTFSTKR